MDRTLISRSLLCLAMLGAGFGAAACGDSEDPKQGEEVDAGNGSIGVGRYGGDCKDGMTRCNDQFGAPLCPVSSGHDGDDLALCQPADLNEGMLLHYGPKDYNDPAEIEKYMMLPYGESENCVYVRTTNTEPVWVNRFHGRMRPESHHLIVTIAPEWPEGVVEGEPTDCDQGEAFGSRWLLGSQDPQIDLEVQGNTPGSVPAKPGDPEYGAGQVIQPNSILRIDMHYVNGTDKNILREGWVYLKAVPAAEVAVPIDMITFFQGSINVPPNSKGTVTARGRCSVPKERNVLMMTGHFHKNGTRFTVWHEPQGGQPQLVYQSHDWDTPGNAWYTPRITNPIVDDEARWGASSGYLKVVPGDFISFECEFDNPTTQVIAFGELGRDQMCNVFGAYFPSDGNVWNCGCLGATCFDGNAADTLEF
jgi:hypothetical protein